MGMTAMLVALALGVVPGTGTRNDAACAGGAAFTFTFKAQSTSQVHVYKDGVEVTTGFTKALNANQDSSPGGTVTFDVAPTCTTLRVQRETPKTQSTVYTPYSAFPAKTTEKALDNLVMQGQEVDRRVTDVDLKYLPPTCPSGWVLTGNGSAYLCVADAVGAAGPTGPTGPTGPPGTSGSLSEWYVDSANGNDSNDGKSASMALRTIAALLAKPIPAGATIYLARGSYWREQLGDTHGGGTALPAGSRVVAYGSGPRPMLDASDAISTGAWSKTAGRTNIYQFTAVPARYEVNKDRWRVWENGTLLAYVADQATCDATPGSWTGPLTATGPAGDILYVHATGSGNPATNAKLYEFPKRDAGFDGGRYVTDPVVMEVVGLHARRNLYDDGAIITAGTVRDCLADDGGSTSAGPSHAFWVNGYCEDCTAISGLNPFISYSGPSHPGVRFKRSRAIGRPGAGAGTYTGIGWYWHTGGGANVFANIICDECTAFGLDYGWAGGDFTNVVLKDSCAARVNKVFEGVPTGNGSVQVLGGTYVLNISGSGNRGLSILAGNASARTVVYGVRMIAKQTVGGGLVYDQSGGSVDVQHSTFVYTDPAVFNGHRVVVNATGPVVFRNNLTATGGGSQVVGTTGASITAADNVYAGDGTFYLTATQYATLAEWKLASSQDSASVTTAVTFLGQPLNGDTRVNAAAATWTLQAGADLDGGMQDEIERRFTKAAASVTP